MPEPVPFEDRRNYTWTDGEQNIGRSKPISERLTNASTIGWEDRGQVNVYQ